MWRLAALLVVLLVGHPLALQPSKYVAITAGIAAALCALGLVAQLTAVLTAGVALALGEYTLALAISNGPSRLGGAIVLGVIVALLLEVGDFDRRFRHAAIGPRVLATQLRYWAGFGVVGAIAAFVLIEAAGAITSVTRVPWSPVLAAAGAFAALAAAAALALRRAH